MSFAKVTLMGNLGKDPETFKYNSNGEERKAVKFPIAVSTGKGEKKSTDWFNCTVFGSQAKSAFEYLKKGKPVVVIGSLTTRKYQTENSSGTSLEVNVDSVQFVPTGETSNGGGNGGGTTTQANGSSTSSGSRRSAPVAVPEDEDVPF